MPCTGKLVAHLRSRTERYAPDADDGRGACARSRPTLGTAEAWPLFDSRACIEPTSPVGPAVRRRRSRPLQQSDARRALDVLTRHRELRIRSTCCPHLPQRQVAIARTRRLISAPASGKVRRYLANWCGRGMRSLRA